MPEMSRWVVNGMERICIFDIARPTSVKASMPIRTVDASPVAAESVATRQVEGVAVADRTAAARPAANQLAPPPLEPPSVRPPPFTGSVRAAVQNVRVKSPPKAPAPCKHPNAKGDEKGGGASRQNDGMDGHTKDAVDDDTWGGWTAGGSVGTCSWTRACRGDDIWPSVHRLAQLSL